MIKISLHNLYCMDEKLQNDGGIASRKLWFSIFCVAAIIFSGKYLPVAVLPEVVAGVLGACSVYVAGNVWAKTKIIGAIKDQPDPTPDPKNDQTNGEPDGKG